MNDHAGGGTGDPLERVDVEGMALTRSQRRILGLVFRRGAVTQADLVEDMDLTQQSVSRIISALLDGGLLTHGERISSGRRGYPSATVCIAPGFTHSFGVSIMTDAVSLALVDFSGAVLHEKKQGFEAMSMSRVGYWIRSAIEATAATRLPEGATIAGVGVGIPGSFTGKRAMFNTPHMLEDWANVDVEAVLAEKLELPVWSENDGNVAALGESMIGVGRWAPSFAYLYLSSGVGGGVILDGKLWRGRHGNAGEFAGGLPPNIYPFPNLELLRHLLTQEGRIFATVNDMLEHFDPDWPAIDVWINRVRDSLSIIVSNATAILDLDAIVFGGRMPKTLAQKIIPHIEFYDQKRRAMARPTAQLVPAEARGDAAAIGAALLPLKAQFFEQA